MNEEFSERIDLKDMDASRKRVTVVVNMFGEPCVGKSAEAMGLASYLKKLGYSVDLVQEKAKEYCYEGRFHKLNNQFLITGEQIDRVDRLVGEVDIVVTDSPIYLGSLYTKDMNLSQSIIDKFHTYNNLNIRLRRDWEFITEARGSGNRAMRTKELLDVREGLIYDYVKPEGSKDLDYAIIKKLIDDKLSDTMSF